MNGLASCVSAVSGMCTCDSGGGDISTVPMADDHCPLPGDSVLMVDGVVVAVVDEANKGTSEPGGRRIYARNPAGGVSASLVFSPSGDVELITTFAGAAESARITVGATGVQVETVLPIVLKSSLMVTIDAPVATFTGAITAGAITAASVASPAVAVAGVPLSPGLMTHTHAYVDTGATPTAAVTSPPTL